MLLQGKDWMVRELFGGSKGFGWTLGALRAGRRRQLTYQVRIFAMRCHHTQLIS